MNDTLSAEDQLLIEHLKLIYKIAWKIHYKYGQDPEDLFSEGCLQYLLKKDKFKSNNGTKYTTFLWNTIWKALLNYVILEQKPITKCSIEIALDIPEDQLTINYKKHRVVEHFAMEAY